MPLAAHEQRDLEKVTVLYDVFKSGYVGVTDA